MFLLGGVLLAERLWRLVSDGVYPVRAGPYVAQNLCSENAVRSCLDLTCL
jgi:hypothetical protein